MNAEQWKRVEELFQESCILSGADRARFLEKACSGDQGLREEVESLLGSHDTVGTRLEEVVLRAGVQVNLGSTSEDSLVASPIGKTLGAYRVTRLLDSGGMGAVYEGVRADDAYRQQVAVKLIKGGMVTEVSLRRFLRERQTLANLDHPSIARLLDGGRTEEGLPYIVMEYIDGEPIDRYCDGRRFPVAERLKLFRSVCAAVHHAHINLIVHRDIKPTNILVTKVGVPKLLDFGIAKILDNEAEATVTTQRLLTPNYASPEQLKGLPITTASDIYSLGVLLHKLLCGRMPFEGGTGAPHELVRLVCEEEPTRPSTALTRTGTASDAPEPGEVAELRGCSLDKLRRRLTGDLDNIVLMALRKEPERRYASVEQFSADIRRHLEGMPVLARNDTFAYRTLKFVKRNRIMVGAAALVLLAVGTGWYLTSRALERESKALVREREQAAQKEAMMQASLGLFKVNRYLVEGSAEYQEQIRILNEWTQRALQLDWPDQEREIEFLSELCEAWSRLHIGKPARPLKERILEIVSSQAEPDELRIADALYNLGRLPEAYEIRKRLLEPPHMDLALGLYGIADEYISENDLETPREIFARARRMMFEVMDAPNEVIVGKLSRESLYRHMCGDVEMSLELQRKAIELARRLQPPNVILVAGALRSLGWVLHDLARFEEAEAHIEEALQVLNARLPSGHPEVAKTKVELALVYKDMGKFGDAEALLRDALRIYEQTHWNDGSAYAETQLSLSKLYADSRDWEQAEEWARSALETYNHMSPTIGVTSAVTMTLLGRVLCHRGKPREALEFLEPSHTFQRETYPIEQWERHKTASILGDAYSRLGRFEKAEPLLLESYPRIEQSRGKHHYRTAQALQRIVAHFKRRKMPAEASKYEALITPEALASPLVHEYE